MCIVLDSVSVCTRGASVPRSNCLLFALGLWWSNRGRTIIGGRRSEGLGGAVPHFVHIEERGNLLVVRDYYPKRRKRRITDHGDCALLFAGEERTRTYRLESTTIVGE